MNPLELTTTGRLEWTNRNRRLARRFGIAAFIWAVFVGPVVGIGVMGEFEKMLGVSSGSRTLGSLVGWVLPGVLLLALCWWNWQSFKWELHKKQFDEKRQAEKASERDPETP